MTLKDLLLSVEKEKLFNSLRKLYPKLQSKECQRCYAVNYDILKSCNVGEDDGEIIEIDFCDKFWHDQGIEAWLSINRGISCILPRQVVLAEDIGNLCTEDITAMCLWRVSFLTHKEVSDAYHNRNM